MKNIFANKINIGKNVEISSKAKIICDEISIGDGTVITGNTVINCKECLIGKNNFFYDVLIEGSLNVGNTKIKIGNENLFAQNTRLNCNDYIEIGNDVNTGEVQIFTHSSSMDVFNGYPFKKAPVKIGSHVWINIGAIIHPGVTVGSNVIILNKSVVNKNIPSGSLAGGIPVKIIKKNYYPKLIQTAEKNEIAKDCIKEYYELLRFKPVNAEVNLMDNLCIEFVSDNKKIIFDLKSRKIIGGMTVQAEDFRDFLRYRGIKFFTGKPFKSISPNWRVEALK